MKQRPYIILSFLFAIAVIIVYTMTNSQYEETEVEERERMETIGQPFDKMTDSDAISARIGHLPHGIVHAKSDLELKPLWFTKSAELKERVKNHWNLLAISVGIKQKSTVDAIVRKFFPENFTIMLFHYDGNVNGWHDFWWSEKVIHVAAAYQTKWWFAKRFLHPDVVSIYDYIFLWDEDLGVDNFHPGRYLKIVKSEGLEISQPALDPDLSEIHHQLTARRKKGRVHRRILGGHRKCTSASEGPPCTGWVEGMAPVFSQSAWRCAWHLIQNDLVHGWGMDMKLGYCAQGDRTRKVGVVDSEFIVHQGVQTLGGSSVKKSPRSGVMDARVEVRKQARLEFQTFQRRWKQAAREDDEWVDPFPQVGSNQKQKKNHVQIL